MNGIDDAKHGRSLEVLMCGYFPGVTSQCAPLTSPVTVSLPDELAVDGWKDVCGGGCGFGVAISASGKLITWGSSDDQGQSYLASGKHGETPEVYPVPTADTVVYASAGWAHCSTVTDKGEVYTWGWKECVPSGKVTVSWRNMKTSEEETYTTKNNQGSCRSQSSKSSKYSITCSNDSASGEEAAEEGNVATQHGFETSVSVDERLSIPPCHVNLDRGVKILSVAAGGRHTLALSDVGQVWGWGYGGDGQLGLGSRIKMVASPHLISCFDPMRGAKFNSCVVRPENADEGAEQHQSTGNYVKGIACGGRHSAVVTDTGSVLAFGWGLYGQCGHGGTEDLLRPTCVRSLLGTRIEAVAAGLWHTVSICANGRVYAFGGNQFGQLGVGTNSDRSEVIPRLIDASVLKGKKAKLASCGARHSSIVTEDGKIFSWGWNKYGQLGVGDTVDRNTPYEVPLKDYVPENIACGWWHTLLLCEKISTGSD